MTQMGGGACSAPQLPGLIAHNRARREFRDAGIAWARAWRIRNKPLFEALFGPEPCRRCGAMHETPAS